MAGAFVKANTGTALTANPTASAWSSALTIGNTIILTLVNDSGTSNYVTGVTGGGVTTWTRVTSQIDSQGSEHEIWWGRVTSAVTTGFGMTFSLAGASRIVWAAMEVSGLSTAPFDKVSTITSGSSTTPLSGTSGTLAQADSFVVGHVGWTTGTSTLAAGSGYTNAASNGAAATSARFGGHESKVVVATTATTAGFTLGTSRPWGALVSAWKAAVSAVDYTATPTDNVGLTDSYQTVNGKIGNVVDNFDDGVIDNQWPGSYTCTETGGRIRLTMAADNNYAGLPTATRDAVASGSYVTWSTLPAAGGSTEVYARHMHWSADTAGTGIGWDYTLIGGVMSMRATSFVSYFDATPTTVTFTAGMTTGIDEAGGTVTMWTSTDGGATKTTRRTLATPSWYGRMYGQLEAHRSADGVGDFAEFDNFNVPSGTAYTATPADAVGITDSVVLTTGPTPIDPVGISDPASVVQTGDRSATDSVGLADSVATVISLSAGVPVEPVGLTDSVSTLYSIGYQAAPADPVGITDTAAATQAGARSVTDLVGLADTTALTQANVRTPVDPVGLADSTSLARMLAPFTEPVGIVDSVDTVIDAAPTPTVTPIRDGSLPVPLSVRLTTAAADVLLVEEIRDVSFRSVVPGGFASATVVLDRVPWHPVPEIGLYGRLYIYDTRSGRTIWEGRVEDPGRSAGADGFQWQVTAVGPSAHARDETFASLWIDTTIDHFQKFGGSKGSTTVSSFTDGSDRDGIKVAFPGGTAAASPQYVSARSLRVYNAGQTLGSVRATAYSSDTSPTWESRMYVYPSASLIDSTTIETSATGFYGEVGSDFSSGQTMLHLRLDRTGSSAAPADEVFTFWYDIVVRTTMVDEEGNPLTDYSDPYVTASQVVQDVVGRHLPQYDALDAFIEVTSDPITQLAYDSTTPYDVLADLMALSGAYYWAAWETVQRSGKWRFEWREWPTWVRYEAGIEDGWDSPGSAAGLFNECLVTWKNRAGRDQTTLVTASVPELTDAGLTRTGLIDLGQEVGTLSAAQSAGQAFLEEHNLPSQNGRLTVARPILDADTGQMIDPWEIRPGGLIRVRGIDAKPNALNADGRDGTTVFRVVAVSFRASDGSAELELDSDALSTSKAIARLQNRRRRR